MKKTRIKWILLAIIFIGLVLGFREVFIYKDMEELVGDLFEEGTEIERIRITVNYGIDDLEKVKTTTIQDNELTSKIIDEFSDMELKKVTDRKDGKYLIYIDYTKQVAEDVTDMDTLRLEFNEQFIDVGDYVPFEIVSDSNHVEIIKSLLNNDDVEWESLED